MPVAPGMRISLGIPYATAARFAAPRPSRVRRDPCRRHELRARRAASARRSARRHRSRHESARDGRSRMLDAERVGAAAAERPQAGARVVPRRLVRHRRVVATGLRRRASRRGTGRRRRLGELSHRRVRLPRRPAVRGRGELRTPRRDLRARVGARQHRELRRRPRACRGVRRVGGRRPASCTRSRRPPRAVSSRAPSSRAARRSRPSTSSAPTPSSRR